MHPYRGCIVPLSYVGPVLEERYFCPVKYTKRLALPRLIIQAFLPLICAVSLSKGTPRSPISGQSDGVRCTNRWMILTRSVFRYLQVTYNVSGVIGDLKSSSTESVTKKIDVIHEESAFLQSQSDRASLKRLGTSLVSLIYALGVRVEMNISSR